METVHPLPIDKGRKEGEGMVGGSKREKKGRTVGGGIPNVGTERLVILADFSGLTGEKKVMYESGGRCAQADYMV